MLTPHLIWKAVCTMFNSLNVGKFLLNVGIFSLNVENNSLNLASYSLNVGV